jgi:hypothetical protein
LLLLLLLRLSKSPAPEDVIPMDDSRSEPATTRAGTLEPAATMLVASRAEYLGVPRADIGQRVGDDQLELFVDGEPAAALLPLMLQRRRDYIALHDIGTKTSLRLLGAVAAALQRKVQHLAIRRQGQGVPLATIRFVEVPGAGGERVRVYSTDVDADSRGRQQLALLLLACSRLGVMLVGEMPAHVLGHSLRPVRDAIAQGPWLNRDLLLVPLGAPGDLPAQAPDLAGSSSSVVRTCLTPTAARPNDAWVQVITAWNALGTPRHTEATPPGARPATPAPAVEGPATVAAPPPAPPPPATGDPHWAAYLDACRATLRGFEAGCIFGAETGEAIAHAGPEEASPMLATQGLLLQCALEAAGQALHEPLGSKDGGTAIEATLLTGGRLLLLHTLPGAGAPMLLAVLDAAVATPPVARQQLARVDATTMPTAPVGADARRAPLDLG